jgi:hypothetical protein
LQKAVNRFSQEYVAMRLLILIPALFVFADPAAAQSWQEYSYPDYSFNISFPADPGIETTTLQVTDDKAVEAHVYSVRRDNAEFTVTVAELADPALTETAVIDHAIKTLSEGGAVQVNVSSRINRVYGRQLSILERDGSRAAVALFDYKGRLYQIEAKSLPDATADATRFVESVVFTGGGSNRTAEELQAAARAACSGVGEPTTAATPSAGASPDARRIAIRCRRQQSLDALASSLNSGDLSGAQQAYATLSQLQGGGRERAGREGAGRGPFADQNARLADAMSRIGQALQSGDLTAAQQALASLQRGRGFYRQP